MADEHEEGRLWQKASSPGVASLDPAIYFPISKAHLVCELYYRHEPDIRYIFSDFGYLPNEGEFIVTYLPRDPAFDKYGQDPLDWSWKWLDPPSMDENSEENIWGPEPYYPGDELLGEPGLAIVDKIVTTKNDEDGSVEVKLYIFPCKTFAKEKNPLGFVEALPEEEKQLFVPLSLSQPGQGHGIVPPGAGSLEPITFPDPAKFRLVRPTWVMATRKEITVTPRFRFLWFNKGAILPEYELGRVRQYAQVVADLKLLENEEVPRQ